MAKDVGDTERAKKEILALFPQETAFDTPKPEQLVRAILGIATNRNDIVLDSFLGSGTTAAVSQKMGRRFIGVEMGEHARTLAAARLRQVVEGEQGGISAAVDWRGGGGFRYCTLGKPIFDEWGAVNEGVTFSDLAAFVFFSDTGNPIPARATRGTPLLGIFEGRAIYLLFSMENAGVAHEAAGNVLTPEALAALPLAEASLVGPRTVYAEGCTVPAERLSAAGVTFKQIPYQLQAS